MYLGRLSDQAGSYFVAFSVGLTIVLQEKDSYAYKYSLITFVVNYTVLFCAAQGGDKPKYINSNMVKLGALWYFIACVGFMCSFHGLASLNFLFICEDLFIFGTGLSFFYTWQTYEPVTFGIFESILAITQIRARIKKQNERKRKEVQLTLGNVNENDMEATVMCRHPEPKP